MNASTLRANRQTKSLIATIAIAVLGTAVAIAFHAYVQTSTALDCVIILSLMAGIGGAIGGLLLASSRRNVMWILAVSVSSATITVLLAVVMQSFAR